MTTTDQPVTFPSLTHDQIMCAMRAAFALALKGMKPYGHNERPCADLASAILEQAAYADERRNIWTMDELRATEALILLDMLPDSMKSGSMSHLVCRVLVRQLFIGWSSARGIEMENKFADAILAHKADESDNSWGADVREGMKDIHKTDKFYRLLARATLGSNPEVVRTAFKSIARCDGGSEDMRIVGQFFHALRGDHTWVDVGQLSLDYAHALGATSRALRAMNLPLGQLYGLVIKVRNPGHLEITGYHSIEEAPLKKATREVRGWLGNIEMYIARWRGEHSDAPMFALDLSVKIVRHYSRHDNEVLATSKKHVAV